MQGSYWYDEFHQLKNCCLPVWQNDSVAKHMRLTFSPAAGWDTLSAATDVSREADITRVKYYRNFVYGHAECASVDD